MRLVMWRHARLFYTTSESAAMQLPTVAVMRRGVLLSDHNVYPSMAVYWCEQSRLTWISGPAFAP